MSEQLYRWFMVMAMSFIVGWLIAHGRRSGVTVTVNELPEQHDLQPPAPTEVEGDER